MMNVAFSVAAATDLEDIADYIGIDNRKRALTFVSELQARCARLADFPLAHQLLASRPESGLRKAVHGRYIILYRIEVRHIVIVRILNGSVDYEAILFPDLSNDT